MPDLWFQARKERQPKKNKATRKSLLCRQGCIAALAAPLLAGIFEEGNDAATQARGRSIASIHGAVAVTIASSCHNFLRTTIPWATHSGGHSTTHQLQSCITWSCPNWISSPSEGMQSIMTIWKPEESGLPRRSQCGKYRQLAVKSHESQRRGNQGKTYVH